jgi:predicted nucleic acid-binding protein
MDSLQIKRWFRALEIAQILFEDQGYHGKFLNQIEEFIRRKTMYSPKISEELVPVLFRLALAKKIPMTKLVNRIIQEYLEKNHAAELNQINEKGVNYGRGQVPIRANSYDQGSK